jgi:hypothetical protein
VLFVEVALSGAKMGAGYETADAAGATKPETPSLRAYTTSEENAAQKANLISDNFGHSDCVIMRDRFKLRDLHFFL